MATRMVYVPQPLNFPEGVRRGSLRPVELRDEAYADQYDWDTFVYDAFHDEDFYYVIAPPMFGEDWRVDWTADFATIGAHADPAMWLDKTMRVRARRPSGTAPAGRMEVRFREKASAFPVVGTAARNDLFAGHRALVTMSKNNDVAWIRDWITFHVANHGATAALIYDNASSAYTPDELLGRLDDLAIDTIVIVHWPFKYGPQGIIKTNSHWDPNFCQHGGLEHARFFFLQKAKSFLNCDVDEFVVAAGEPASIFEHTENGSGYSYFHGQWIEPIGAGGEQPKPLSERRHKDFIYRNRDRKLHYHAASKYCVAVQKLQDSVQCATHRIIDARRHGVFAFGDIQEEARFSYRHFKAINTNWRWRRDWLPEINLDGVEVDVDLERAMERAF